MRGGRIRASAPAYCADCLEKQRVIDRQVEEIQRLKEKLRRQERTAKEAPFGSSTPSSKQLLKASSKAEARLKRGGAVPGHEGHGRGSASEEEADGVEELDAPDVCPDCGCATEDWGTRERTVVDCEPVRSKTWLLRIHARRCPCCGKTVRPRPKGVLPRSRYSNRLVAQAAKWIYADGLTLGHVSRQLGVPEGALAGRMHALAAIFRPVSDALVEAYRAAPVKHADETGWREDGVNGYVWGFFTPGLALFRCRHTRSGDVAAEVFGPGPHTGTLVVDRYAAYNRFLGFIQYCYAHLLREVEDLVKENLGNAECAAFADAFAPLLAEAMGLRRVAADEAAFHVRAAELKEAIERRAAEPARHPGVQRIQSIFRENAHRLYRWATSRDIPADNNHAERGLRPVVISRKVSFGSQSPKGLETREVLMTVLNTVAKLTDDSLAAIVRTLDALVEDPALDVAGHLLAEARLPVPG